MATAVVAADDQMTSPMSAVHEARVRVRLGQPLDYRSTLSDVGQQILADAPAAEHAKFSTDISADKRPWQWELSDVGLSMLVSAKEKVPDRPKELLDGLLRDAVRRSMSSFQRDVDASEQVRAEEQRVRFLQRRVSHARLLRSCGCLLLLSDALSVSRQLVIMHGLWIVCYASQGSPEAELTLVFLIEKALGHNSASHTEPEPSQHCAIECGWCGKPAQSESDHSVIRMCLHH